MKTKSPMSHTDRSNMRPMCAQYSVSDSLLAAFGQTGKNSEVSPVKTQSHHSPISDVNIQPIKESLNVTATISPSPKRRRLSREPRCSLNHEQEQERKRKQERVHSLIGAEPTLACPAPEMEQEQEQEQEQEHEQEHEQKREREHVVKEAGETAQSRPALLPPSAVASDAGPTFSERERDDAEPDWFAGLEELPLLAQPPARGELEARRSALWLRVKHEHRVALAFARLHRRPFGVPRGSGTKSGSQSHNDTDTDTARDQRRRAAAPRWLRSLARRPRRQANAAALITSEANTRSLTSHTQHDTHISQRTS